MPDPVNVDVNVNVNEFFASDHVHAFVHESEESAKKIFPKEKILPDCNAVSLF
jgi:hypothetical protein